MSSETTSIDKLRKELEDGIRTHTEAILTMKRRLNSLVSITRLPPELLTEIFLHFADLERASAVRPYHCATPYGGGHQVGSVYNWVRIAHVCHHWREVALTAPRLWTTISVGYNVAPVREMLQRAKHEAA